jgi:hypothetical protein
MLIGDWQGVAAAILSCQGLDSSAGGFCLIQAKEVNFSLLCRSKSG